MTKRIFFLIYISVLPIFGGAQQVYKKGNHNQWLSDYSTTYEMRFRTQDFSTFAYDRKTDFYHSRKVKSVEVLTKDSIPFWKVRFNQDGSILDVGFRSGNFYTVNEIRMPNEKEGVNITSYYQENILVRVDSVFYYYKQYKNGDSLLEITFQRIENYRMGYLINEKNRYYNERYFGKPIQYDAMSVYIPMNFIYGGEVPEKMNYYDIPFKTDYDSLTLFHYSSSTNSNNRGGYLISSKEYFDIVSMNHPFYRENNVYENNNYVEGANFLEPSFYQPRMFCSVYPDNYFPADNGYRSGYHYDTSGLITEYYNEFYPEDTAATRIARIEAKNREKEIVPPQNNFGVVLSPYESGPIIIRQKEPIRVDTYLYRYEFFE